MGNMSYYNIIIQQLKNNMTLKQPHIFTFHEEYVDQTTYM